MNLHELVSPHVDQKIQEYQEIVDFLKTKQEYLKSNAMRLSKKYIVELYRDYQLPPRNDIRHLSHNLFYYIRNQYNYHKQFDLHIYNYQQTIHTKFPNIENVNQYQLTITFPSYKKHVGKQTKKQISVEGLDHEHAEIGAKLVEYIISFYKAGNEIHHFLTTIKQLRSVTKHIKKHFE